MPSRKIILLLLIILSTCIINAQPAVEKCSIPVQLMHMIKTYHYQPQPLTDSFSSDVFDLFLKGLDPYALVFIKPDIDTLEYYRYKLDDEIKEESCRFINLTSDVFKNRLNRASALSAKLLDKPLNLSKKDTITFFSKLSVEYAKDEAALTNRWEKYLKYELLTYLFTPEDELDNPYLKPTKEHLSKEPEIRKKLKIKEARFFKIFLEHPMGFNNLVSTVFCDAVAARMDPHTLYLSDNDRKNFEASLSSEALSFGINFEETLTGNVNVSSLTPGGPAWKSNELNRGDILMKMQFPGKDPVDLTFSNLQEIYSLLSAVNVDKVELTVKKTGGLVKSVTLIKEKIRQDENVIKSFILNGSKKIGYVSLPGFYTEWETIEGKGCANDLAKEIVKLKQEQVQGIILDLRNNGGGSMEEAADIAGIFIDEGPLYVIHSRDMKPAVKKDMNRGTIYNGPLLVLVNGSSASASELLAATLQDYNRALIVGSATFGKATAQHILPVDRNYNPMNYNPEGSNANGFVSITMSKFYRVTGASHQLKGVQPDVNLPYLTSHEDYQEAKFPYAMPADSTDKKTYYQPMAALPVKQVETMSAQRISTNNKFNRIKSLNDTLSNLMEGEYPVPIEIESFRKSEKKNFELTKEIEELVKQNSDLFTVENNKQDISVIQLDSGSGEINKVLIQNIQEDIYIQESFQIMLDLINLINSPDEKN